MKKIVTLLVGFGLLASSALYASGMDGKMKMDMKMDQGKMSMSKGNMAAYNETMKAGRYKVTFSSSKPLSAGKNPMSVMIMRKGKPVNDARVKIKFFMGEEKDMGYMEYKVDAKSNGDMYKCNVDISMGGTWQYHLKFKTKDGRIQKVKGRINL